MIKAVLAFCRSWVCIICMFIFTVFCMLFVGLYVMLFGDEQSYIRGWKYVSSGYKWIAQYIGGLDYKVIGNKPDWNRSVMYAIRHESSWETLVFPYEFYFPLIFVKKELSQIPIFNMFMIATLSVFVDRKNGLKSLRDGMTRVKCALMLGKRHIVIFPEGRRKESGVYDGFQRGISNFYHAANVPVVPVVLDSGKYWPAKKLRIYPGTVQVKFMDEIPAGLSKDELMRRLEASFVQGLKDIGNWSEKSRLMYEGISQPSDEQIEQ